MTTEFRNPFRPGAGHMPPYLAGRETELHEFGRLLNQDPILQNLILTGLRGIGKTVLLETFKPLALENGWFWVGTDMSESSSVSEETLSIRLLTDLSVLTSSFELTVQPAKGAGFIQPSLERYSLDYQTLQRRWQEVPGLASDKLKNIRQKSSAGALPRGPFPGGASPEGLPRVGRCRKATTGR